MKKVCSSFLALAVASMLCLTGCGGGVSTSSPSDTSKPNSTESTVTNKTLKVAALESAYGTEIWKNVAAEFEKDNPGVKIQLTTDKSLEDVIGAQMKAGDYPDFVHLSLGRKAALPETLIKEKALLDISDVMNMTIPGESKTVKDKLLPGFATSSTIQPYGDGKNYMMPMFYAPCGLFYDANLFKTNGWTVPTTWDEMWELATKAKAKDISLFTYATTGYFDTLIYSLLNQAGGNTFFQDSMNYKDDVWKTPEAQKMFDIIYKLAQNTEPSTPSNATNTNYLKNQQLILNDKALFMPNGTWVTGEMKDAPRADGFQWGFMPLPALTSGGDRYSYTYFEQCWVPSGAKNPDLAKKFMSFLYSDKAAKIFLSNSTPAVQPIPGLSSTLTGDNKLFYSIYDTGAKATMDKFASTKPVEGVDISKSLFATIDSLVTGNKTQSEWIDSVESASDKLREAK